MCSLIHLIQTNVWEIPLVELEFPGRERPPQALRASPTVILTQGGHCFLVKSDVRGFILEEEGWLACQGLAGLGLLSLCFTCGHTAELLRLERN